MHELRRSGKIVWRDAERGWAGEPEDVVNRLSTLGFEECKRETARNQRGRRSTGGVWQGLNRATGSVAAMIWTRAGEADPALMFVELDGERFESRNMDG